MSFESELEVIYRESLCFLAFTQRTLSLNSKNNKLSEQLSKEIDLWAGLNYNQEFDSILATLLCKSKKHVNSDLENLLFYNLKYKKNFNKLLKRIRQIIIQCIENIDAIWTSYHNFVYIYQLFKDNDGRLTNFLFYQFNKNSALFNEEIEIYKIIKLINTCDLKNKQKLVEQIKQNKVEPKVFCRTKYALDIEIPNASDILKYYFQNIDNLKKIVDCVIIYLNAKNLIEHEDSENLVNGNGYNPSDNYLYYCKLQLINTISDKINVSCYSISSQNNSEETFAKLF